MSENDKHVAILAADLYEDLELWYPLLRMREAGARVTVVGSEAGKTYHGKYGYPVTAHAAAAQMDPAGLDAVIVPGGYAPDHMRRDENLVSLVRQVFERDRLVAFICHGGWMPASADIVRDRRVTSFFAIRADMEHAGAKWVDEEVVRDGNLISSRTPENLPAFCVMVLQALEER